MTIVGLPVAKPPFRAPCNGCGVCCLAQLCPIAIDWLPGVTTPCPALETEDGRFWCGLIRHPSKHLGIRFNGDSILSPMIAKGVGLGQGCSMEDGVLDPEEVHP